MCDLPKVPSPSKISEAHISFAPAAGKIKFIGIRLKKHLYRIYKRETLKLE